ncbi:MAG: hypothetical protein U0235_04685 [Polyangiaceae bacterium]
MRVLSQIPRSDGEGDLLAELAAGHPYRRVAEVPAQFASHLAGALPPVALARLHGAFVRGVLEMPRGKDDVVELLVERIKAHGGEVMFHERVQRLVTKGSRATFVELADEGTTVGVQFVVGEMPALALTSLATEFEPSRRALAAVPTVTPRARRFVVSMLVRKAGLPELLARDVYIVGGPDEPPVHLQVDDVAPANVAGARASRPDGEPLALLVAETLLPEGAAPRAFRERVLRIVEAHLPFIEQHYVLVDSPNDGRPLWDYRSGRRVSVERALLRSGGGLVEPEPMVPQLEVSPAGLHGLAGDGLRTPLGNAFVVGPSVMPALGQEGELLSAWGAARIITRTDRRKEKMRREMWSKIEIG